MLTVTDLVLISSKQMGHSLPLKGSSITILSQKMFPIRPNQLVRPNKMDASKKLCMQCANYVAEKGYCALFYRSAKSALEYYCQGWWFKKVSPKKTNGSRV